MTTQTATPNFALTINDYNLNNIRIGTVTVDLADIQEDLKQTGLSRFKVTDMTFEGSSTVKKQNRSKVCKPTCKTNISFRGADGKFISYKTLGGVIDLEDFSTIPNFPQA